MSAAGQKSAKQAEHPKPLGAGRGLVRQAVVEERRRKSTSYAIPRGE